MTPDRPVPSFEDSWRRIEWANRDAQALENLLRGFLSTDPYPILLQPQGDRWKASLDADVDPEHEIVVLAEASRLLGSFLEHIRAGLNYLTYQLALVSLRQYPSLKGRLKPDAVEFPIFKTPRLFHAHNRIEHLPDEYRNPIIDVQPYDGRHNDLWVLHELARKFRHRLIHPMPILPVEKYHGINAPGLHEIESSYSGGPLKAGDELFTFRFLGAESDVYPRAALQIGIGDSCCWGRDCMNVLNGIGEEVDPIFNLFSDLFGL